MLCQIFSYDFPKIRKDPKIFLRSFKNVALGSKKSSIGNGLWGIKWLPGRWRHVTPKSQSRDPIKPIRLELNISKTAGDGI